MIEEDHEIDSNREYVAANGTKYFYYADSMANSKVQLSNMVDELLEEEILSGEIYCSFAMDIDEWKDIVFAAMDKVGMNGSVSLEISGKVASFDIQEDAN